MNYTSIGRRVIWVVMFSFSLMSSACSGRCVNVLSKGQTSGGSHRRTCINTIMSTATRRMCGWTSIKRRYLQKCIFCAPSSWVRQTNGLRLVPPLDKVCTLKHQRWNTGMMSSNVTQLICCNDYTEYSNPMALIAIGLLFRSFLIAIFSHAWLCLVHLSRQRQ